jgi:hypothetical protein
MIKMIAILSPRKGDPGNEHTSGEEIQERYTRPAKKNITDGDEFLD